MEIAVAVDNFADRLLAAIDEKKTPLVVGLDPVYENLPTAITAHRDLNDHEDVEAAVDAILEFCTRLLKVVAPMCRPSKLTPHFSSNIMRTELKRSPRSCRKPPRMD